MPDSLPEDQSYRAYNTGVGKANESRVILSVSEEGLSLNKEWGTTLAAQKQGVHIFAERVKFSGTFAVTNIDPAHGFTLSTCFLETDGASKDELKIIAENGAPNDAGAQRDPASIDGKDAPALAVYVENLSDIQANQLYLSAKGGAGGSTRQKAGTGGNGGNGGLIQLIGYTALRPFVLQLYEVVQVLRLSKNQLGDEATLQPSHPIFTTIANLLRTVDTASLANSTGDALKAVFDPIRQPLKIWGTKGEKVQSVLETVFEVYSDVGGYSKETFERKLKSHLDIAGGASGSSEVVGDGGQRGSSGKVGEEGRESVVLPLNPFRDDERKVLRQQTRIWVHPEQCEMLYERAMSYWSFDARAQATELLGRLILRLSFLPLEKTDPLFIAYRASEAQLHCPRSIERLEAVLQDAVAQFFIIGNGLVDYYGRSPEWVPRLSFAAYERTLKDTLAVHKTFEETYMKYTSVKKDVDAAKKEMHAIKLGASEQLNRLEKDVAVQRDIAVALAKTIHAADKPIRDAQTKFQNAFEDVKDKIKRTHELSPQTVISAVKNIAEKPKDPETIIKAGWSVFSDLDMKVPNDLGDVVDKDLLIKKIRSGAATSLENFKTDIDANELDGMYEIDVKVPKMLLEEEALKKILADYSKSAFADAGKKLQDAFKALTDAISTCNNNKLAYNTALRTMANFREDAKKAEEATRLADKKDPVAPGICLDLDQMTALVGAIYNSSRARVLKYLREAQLALWFKTLVLPEPLYRVGNARSIKLGDLPLSITSAVLQNMHENLREHFNRIRNDQSNAATAFPADWEHTQGLKCKLPSDLVWELYKNKRIQVAIPAVLRGQSVDDLRERINREFVDMADVRIHRARFFWTGLEVKNAVEEPLLQTSLSHGGLETIVARDGTKWEFEHNALYIMHSYFYRGGREVDQHAGTFNGGAARPTDRIDEDIELGQPGPFTTWTIDVQGTDWSKWKDHGMNDGELGAYLEFSGSNYPFAH